MQTQYLISAEAPPVRPYDAEQMAQGLAEQLALLSELGGYLLSPDKAPAGTKRLSNLLHSSKWTAKVVQDELWQRADQQVQSWQEQGEEALAIWESSEWEKPESLASEDLCAVRSSKAKRLTHIKPGYYTPPGRPIFVPGLPWLAVIVVGRSVQLGPPMLAAMRFVLRWRGDYQLYDAQGNRRKAWRIAFGKRGWSERTIWDSRRAQWVHASVLALPVTHPDHRDTPLWRVVLAYMRRWQIDLAWRFDKSDLAFQSPRLWRWPERMKLLAMARLAYALLLHLLAPRCESLRLWLLRTLCHRTGWHLRRVKIPL